MSEKINYEDYDEDERERYTITNRNGYEVYSGIHTSCDEAFSCYVSKLIEKEGYSFHSEMLEPCEEDDNAEERI